MSLECGGVCHLLYMIWKSIPRRGSCIGEATFTEFDVCPWSLIFAGACGAKQMQWNVAIKLNLFNLLEILFNVVDF